MSSKEWVKLVIGGVVVLMVVYCLVSVFKQRQLIDELSDELSEKNVVQTQLLQEQNNFIKNVSSQLVKISEAFSNQKVVNEQLIVKLNSVESAAPVKVEQVKPDMKNVEDRIKLVLSQIQQLEKDRVSGDTFNKWVQKVETLVNNSLIEVSKPSTVPPLKPMQNVTQVVNRVALSNAEKAKMVNLVKKEIFKQFEKANYGNFVGDDFELKEGFFGARIYPDELESHNPVPQM